MTQNSVTQANLIEIKSAAQQLSDTIGVEVFNAASSSSVNLSTDTFTILNHGFTNGSTVVYNRNGGTAIGGLVDGATYYVKAVTTDTFQLTLNSNLSGNANLSSLGTGSQMLTTTTSTNLQAATQLTKIYEQLQSARRLSYGSIDEDAATAFDNLIADLAPVANAFTRYQTGTGSFSAVQTEINGVSKLLVGNFKNTLDEFERKWSIQDRVFFEYSKTGEADLNNQLGQLGDALDTLSHVIDVTNKIDLALSIQPRNSSGTTLVNGDSNLTSDFYTAGENDLFIPVTSISGTLSTTDVTNNTITSAGHGFSNGDRVILNVSGTVPGGLTNGNVYYVVSAATDTLKLSATSGGSAIDITSAGSGTVSLTKQQNAMTYTYYAVQELMQLQTGFVSGSAVRTAIDAALASLTGYGANTTTWQTAGNPSTNASTWNVTFRNFWQDTTLRRRINDLQTNLSSQNDVEKQNLRKAMFVYQEFIKSAGTVMDRVFDAIKGIASRIGR